MPGICLQCPGKVVEIAHGSTCLLRSRSPPPSHARMHCRLTRWRHDLDLAVPVPRRSVPLVPTVPRPVLLLAIRRRGNCSICGSLCSPMSACGSSNPCPTLLRVHLRAHLRCSASTNPVHLPFLASSYLQRSYLCLPLLAKRRSHEQSARSALGAEQTDARSELAARSS